MLTSARKLCIEIYNDFRSGNVMKFDEILRSAHSGKDVFDGVRLEASRALVSVEQTKFVGGYVLILLAFLLL